VAPLACRQPGCDNRKKVEKNFCRHSAEVLLFQDRPDAGKIFKPILMKLFISDIDGVDHLEPLLFRFYT